MTNKLIKLLSFLKKQKSTDEFIFLIESRIDGSIIFLEKHKEYEPHSFYARGKIDAYTEILNLFKMVENEK